MRATVRAVVDCGSNSTRLWLRADPTGPPRRWERVTRLGQGVDETGRLADEALARTLAAVRDYADTWTDAGVTADDVVVMATSAVRDAANRDAYVDGVRAATGVTPVVLTGTQEARCSFVGATRALDHDGPVLVVDIGGGSTELVHGTAGDAAGIDAVSLQLGTVRLTERCLPGDPPDPADVQVARGAARDLVVEGLGQVGLGPDERPAALRVVAVAGTATTLAGLDLGRDDPDALDGHVMATTDVADLAATLVPLSARDRLGVGPLSPGRADVIAAGALILDEVLAAVDVDEVTVSLADVMDGVAALWPLDVESASA